MTVLNRFKLTLILISLFYSILITGMKCALRNKIIYVRSEGYCSADTIQAIFHHLTLSECADQCTSKAQGIDCTLFEYDAIRSKCILKEGNGNLVNRILSMTNDYNISLFQQLCLPDEQVCPSPFAFERLPGYVLMGIAMEVIKVESVEECLNMCLNAKKEMEMECRSVMYYYDTGECILNNENRATSAAMLTNDTLNMRVDYFENNCFDVQCPNDFILHWIKVAKFTISNKYDVIVEQVTKEQCLNYCLENKVNGQLFPCKLYAYNEIKMLCHLTSESGLLHPVMPDENWSIPDDFDLYEYYEKICLKGLTRCQDSSFEHVSNHALLNVTNKVVTASMASCLEICLRSGKQCNSVMFFHNKDECVLSKTTQYSNVEQFQYFPEVDYFDNVCDYRISANMPLENEMIKMLPPMIHEKLNGTKNLRLYGTRLLSFANDLDFDNINEHESVDLEAIHEKLETDCGATSIFISLIFPTPTVGAIFIKDHFATCRSEFANTMNATMEIALSTLRQDNPPCPGYEISPSTWSFVVVVQTNGLGIPGLMTDGDRVFNITCDYSIVHGARNSIQDTLSLQQTAQDWSSIPFSTDHVRLTVFRGDQPVSTAVMGEELEMRWTVVEDHTEKIGLFVNRCIAERLDGTPPSPSPLTLIANGCIDNKVSRLLMQHPIVPFGGGLKTKIKVFRFDGSRRVRILCSVDICIEKCLSVGCNKEVDNLRNSGKKKRQISNYPNQETSAYKVKRQVITGTFTIVEKNSETIANENVTKTGERSVQQDMGPFQFPENSHLCSQSIGFFILIGITVILLIIQIFMLCKYRRFKTQGSVSSGSERSCSVISVPQRVYFGREECYPTESHITLSEITRTRNENTTSGRRVFVM